MKNILKSTFVVAVLCLFSCRLQAQVLFKLVSTLPVGSDPNSIALADVNGDGKADLICANYYGNTLSVLTNNGSGGFVLSGTYGNVGSFPIVVTAADVNGDGKVDLICVGSTLTVLTNNGTGGFVRSGQYATVGNGPLWVTVADVNGDDKVDLITANWGSGSGNTLTVLTNNGSGGFVIASAPVTGNGPICVSAVDVNGDGRPDLISANMTDNTLSVLTNSGSGGFILAATCPVGNGSRFVTAADVNGDGRPDLISANWGDNTLTVLTNNGSGGFGFKSTIAVGNGALFVAAADINGDGAVDLICANNTDTTLTVVTNNGGGGFILATNLSVGGNPNCVVALDVNGDGRLDLISASYRNNALTVWTNATSYLPATSPTITAQPLSITNLAGTTATFVVGASGGALAYQWQFNGTNLATATNNSLILPNLALSQAGSYSVLVSNALGSTNSLAATLTVNVPVCTPAPSGLVGWWKADGDGADSVGGDNATVPAGVTYVPGEVGLGFSLNGDANRILAPDAPQLNFGASQNFSIETWIQPLSNPGNYTDLSGQVMTVISKRTSPNSSVALGYEMYLGGGRLCFQLSDSLNDSMNYYNLGAEADLRDGKFHHVAVTIQRNSTTGLKFYVDGQLIGTFDPTTVPGDLGNTSPLRIGNHPDPGIAAFYHGLIDEVSLYNRALSSDEITAIYNAGSAGKSYTPVAPVITAQPTNQTVLVGGTANFSVSASGTGPLSYQWSLNGTNIDGATSATLTLGNVQLTQIGNYSVAITNLVGSTNSLAATLAVVLPPVITQQPQGQSVASYTSVSFTVAATGSGPLSYQWRKGWTNLVDGSNISGSTTTNLTLASLSMNDGGNYDVVVSNPYATTNSASAVLTVPQTGMMLGSASAMSGNTVVVPVLMNALGVENTFLASVGYDPAMLVLQSVQLGQATAGTFLLENDTKTNSGLVGIAIQLSTGTGVPVGTNEQVALLTFQAMPVSSNTTVSVFFTNNPTRQQTLDNNFDLLPTVYSNGIVTLLPAEYAADVYPRTSGDSQVEARDWQEVGRMVAGLDVPTNSDEFARADCAPRGVPDGILTVADWVQAGRYAMNLDPLTLVTLPPVPSAGIVKNLKFTPFGGPSPARTLQIGSAVAQRGQTVSVPVQLVCAASENAVGLTVSFDTNRLKLTRVTMGSAMPGGRTNINYNRPGKLGMAVAMSPGASLAAGTNQLLVLQFDTLTNASGPVALTLDSSVVQLQVVDKTANALAANYVSGTVVLPPQPVVTTVKAGENLQLTWPISTGTFHVESAGNPLGPWRDASLTITTNGANATVTVIPFSQQQFFRLVGQ